MNISQQKEIVYYDWKNKKDNAYFAFYTSQALNNVNNILKNVSYIIDNVEDNLSDDNQLWSNAKTISILKNNRNAVAQKSAMNLLESNMSFAVKSISDPLLVGNRLSYFLWLLKNFRNEYAHFHEKILDTRTTVDRETDPKTLNTLKNFYTGSKSFENELLLLKKSAIEELEKRLKIDLQSLKTDSEYKTFKYKFLRPTSSNHFTEDNFIFFLSLFLTTKETMQLLNGIRGKKNTTKEEFQWIRKVFTIFNVKRFQPKIKSDNPKDSLVLNIINDLSKIPIHLKKYLTDEAKEKLTYTIQETIDEEGNVILQNSEAVTKHDELYSYRCLQFLELFGVANHTNFNINLGKAFIKKPYNKVINNDTYIRFLDKEIHSFGKLIDFDDTYFEGFVERINSENGIITKFKEPLKFYSPKYHFSNNRIGINLTNREKIIIKDYDKNGKLFIKNESPEYFISVKAIPYFTYCMINYTEGKTLGVVRKFGSNFKKFLGDIISGKTIDKEKLQEEYSLKIHWIPSLIRENLFKENKTSLKDVAEKKIDSLKQETKLIIENIDIDPKERDRDFRFSYKKGDLATFIAKDIIYFMEPKEEQINDKIAVSKLSSLEYDILQSKLAFYGKHESDLKILFRNWELYERHPFLSKVSMEKVRDRRGRMQQIGIKKFFKNYMYQRSYYLNDWKFETEKKYHFIDNYKVAKNQDQIISYAQNLLNHSYYIPNDIFADFINLNSDKKLEKANSNFLIFQNLEKFKNQWFYESANYKKDLDKKESYVRDQQIRKAITLDRILWNMLIKNNQIPELSEIFKEKNLSHYNLEENFLDQPIDLKANFLLTKQDFRYLGLEKDVVFKIVSKRKIKDYGIFRHLMKDRRIPNILAFYAKHKKIESLDSDLINREILNFENIKIDILKKILEIDKSIYHVYKNKNILHELNENFRIDLENLQLDDTELVNNIVEVRNKLFHNKIPEILFDDEIDFTTSFYKKVEEICNNISLAINTKYPN